MLQGERPSSPATTGCSDNFQPRGHRRRHRGACRRSRSTFDIDANGILNVSAKDKGTGKETNVRIEILVTSGLSDGGESIE